MKLAWALCADFRAYLVRGVLLSSDGRKADAQRMFLQARFNPHSIKFSLDFGLARSGDRESDWRMADAHRMFLQERHRPAHWRKLYLEGSR